MSTAFDLERKRLRALRASDVLDPAPERRFDRIAHLAAERFNVPIALISLVNEDRQWFKSCVGLDVGQTYRDLVCDHAIGDAEHGILIIEDAARDPRFAANPLVTGKPGIRFFLGASLTTVDGDNLGTLCVIDTVPRARPHEKDLDFLRSLAAMVVDELELSLARNALDEKARLMSLVEVMAGIGHWSFDPHSGEVTWSDEVFRIHGLPVGGAVPDYDTIQRLYHEEDRPILQSAVDRAIALGEGYGFTLRIIRPDGTVRHVLAKAECIVDAGGTTRSITGLFQDITDQHLAALALSESERRYRLLAENASDVISVYGMDGVFNYLSPSVEPLLGYRPDELVGRSPYDFICADDHERVAAAFAEHLASADSMTIEYRANAKDGRTVWLEAKPRFHRDAAGKVFQISDAVRDVTVRREREAALRLAQAAAEESARSKTIFLANMSHEIRTPMNGVLGFTELLLAEDLPEAQRRKIRMIADSGAAMMRLLNDILDLSKLEAGQMDIASAPLAPRDLLKTCAALMQPLAEKKGLRLTTTVDGAVPETILGDDLRLRQILLNLIGNAVKFTECGHVTASVRVAGPDSAPVLEIIVDDSGVGIAVEQQRTIFDQFVQADQSIVRRYGGTGLGLTISAQLARLMKGTLTLASEPNVGTTVTLRFPLLRAEAAGSGDLAQDRASAPIDQRSAPRVLVAEDHPINQYLITALLEKFGIVPDVVDDGDAAIAAVVAAAHGPSPYQLVLMDVQMPRTDGLTAARAIRTCGIAPGRLPIVALSANAFASEARQSIDAGMQDHVAKPISLKALQAIITQWLPGSIASLDQKAG